MSFSGTQASDNNSSSEPAHQEINNDILDFLNEWRERLALDILENHEENQWVFDGEFLNLPVLRAVVQQFLDRLVLVRFAEDHQVLPADTLREMYEICQHNEYTFSMGEFLNRLFLRFDEKHNSALFASGVVDEAVFSDVVLLPLIEKLYEVDFRVMPVDVLSNSYEQYLGKTLTLYEGEIRTGDNLETRKKQDIHYTPQVIVQHIVDQSLGRYLYGTVNGRADDDPIEGETRKSSRDIHDLKVLDSACGSGSFLIYAYDVLADFYQGEIRRIIDEINQQESVLGSEDADPIDIEIAVAPLRAEYVRIKDYPRMILEQHLYGVDLDPQAVEVAAVNLMMRMMERDSQTQRLPLILNQTVKVGNSLIGLRADDPRLNPYRESLLTIQALRRELIGTPNTDPNHGEMVRVLHELSQFVNNTLNVDFVGQFSDLDRVRPFHWGVEFPEVFFKEDGTLRENPGFQVVIGSPPWEIIQPDLREFYAQFDPDIESLNGKQTKTRIEELNAENPTIVAHWKIHRAGIDESAAYFLATDEYTRQGRGNATTYKLFIERMYGLLMIGGHLGYIVPAGIYSDLDTAELRQMLFETGRMEYLYGLANVWQSFPEDDWRSTVALIGMRKGGQTDHFNVMFYTNHADWESIDIQDLRYVLNDESFRFKLSLPMLERFSPDNLSILEFRNQHDYDIAEKMSDSYSPLDTQIEGLWDVHIAQEFNTITHHDLLNQEGVGFPLYEGDMIQQYDPYFAPPRYWIKEDLVLDNLQNPAAAKWSRGYRFIYRDAARATDERTFIAAVLPPDTFAGHTTWVGITPNGATTLVQVALLNSFCVDWIVRLKVGTRITPPIVNTLPIPRLTTGDLFFEEIVPRAARLVCIQAEFAGLWESVMGDVWDESKGATDASERQMLRDEIDALVAHLYGLSRADFAHILSTFPLIFPDDAAGRAKRDRLLEVYDGMG